MDEEVYTSFTRQCASVETRLHLPASPFRNQSDNQNIDMSVGMCLLPNQLITLPLNDDTAVSSGHGVSVLESEVSVVLDMSDMDRKERVVWLQMRRKSFTNTIFLVRKKSEKIQPPASQTPSVLHPIRIIQHP